MAKCKTCGKVSQEQWDYGAIKKERLLNHLCDVLSESIENDDGSLRQAFKEEGLNYDEIVEEGLKFIRHLESKIAFMEQLAKIDRLF